MKVEITKNLKQKERIVKKIGMDYKKIKFIENHSFMICENSDDYLSQTKDVKYYTSLKDKIDYILIQLDEELSKFIYNEYLSSRVENWWIYKYSRSTYYRLKHRAIDTFLEWWYV